MSNKHTFGSTQKSRSSSDSFINKNHRFDSVLSNKKYYNVTLTGFSQTSSIFTKFIQKNVIFVNGVKIYVALNSSVFQNRSGMTSGSRVASTVDSPRASFFSRNRISFSPSEQKNMGQAIFRNDNSIVVRDLQKLIFYGEKFISSPFSITANANVFHYFYVSEWDSYLMSDLDAMLLSSMDYEVV